MQKEDAARVRQSSSLQMSVCTHLAAEETVVQGGVVRVHQQRFESPARHQLLHAPDQRS